MKKCNRCSRKLSLENFAKRGDGLQAYCRDCNREHKRQWIVNNRDKVAKNTMWSKYRLRPEAYDLLMKQQAGLCGLCKEPFEGTPHVDHDHKCCDSAYTCGKCVRGLLCSRCNRILGGYEQALKYDVQSYLKNGLLV